MRSYGRIYEVRLRSDEAHLAMFIVLSGLCPENRLPCSTVQGVACSCSTYDTLVGRVGQCEIDYVDLNDKL